MLVIGSLRRAVDLAIAPKHRRMAVTFVDAGRDDLEAIAALWFRAQAARRPGPFVTIADSRALVAQRVAQPGSWFIFAAEGQRVVGIAYGAPGRNDDGLGKPIRGLLHLGMIAVEPHDWGRGIGKGLVQQSFAMARERAFREMQLWTHADNLRAQKLFEGLGFTRSGRIKRDPRGETIVHYACSLHTSAT